MKRPPSQSSARPKPKSPPAAAVTAVRPRTKPAEVRREELLDAAERLFVEKGIASTSVEEIVAAADVAKGTFYLQFDSKHALVMALRERFVATFGERIERALVSVAEDDWEGRLRVWVASGVQAYLDTMALHDVIFHEYHSGDHRLATDNLVVNNLAKFLTAGVRAGAWTLDDPTLTSVMLFYALHGAVDKMVLTKTRIDRKHLTRMLESFFLRAVGLGS